MVFAAPLDYNHAPVPPDGDVRGGGLAADIALHPKILPRRPRLIFSWAGAGASAEEPTVGDEAVPGLNYLHPPARRRAPLLIRVGALAAVLADLALLTAVFIWNGGRFWGPYLNPPVTVSWAHPILLASLLLGVTGVITSGVGLVRPAPWGLKVTAAAASLAYLAGFVCVVVFGLV